MHNCFSASQKQSFWHGLKVNIRRVPAMFELPGSFPPRQRRGADKSGNIPDGTTWWPLDDIITHKHTHTYIIYIYIIRVYIYMYIYIYILYIYISGNIQEIMKDIMKFTQFWAHWLVLVTILLHLRGIDIKQYSSNEFSLGNTVVYPMP